MPVFSSSKKSLCYSVMIIKVDNLQSCLSKHLEHWFLFRTLVYYVQEMMLYNDLMVIMNDNCCFNHTLLVCLFCMNIKQGHREFSLPITFFIMISVIITFLKKKKFSLILILVSLLSPWHLPPTCPPPTFSCLFVPSPRPSGTPECFSPIGERVIYLCIVGF